MKAKQAPRKRAAAGAVAAALANLQGVTGIVLFGSVARGTADAESDIDLLVVVNSSTSSTSELLRHLPDHLQRDDVAVSMHTIESLREYLQKWSRFAAHMQREGIVLYDSKGQVASALADDITVTVKNELEAQRTYLQQFNHLDRFGGRFLFPLAHLYRIGRAAAFAQLAQRGHLEFDRHIAFGQLKNFEPSVADDLRAIEDLEPFYSRVRNADPALELPFDPVGRAAELRVAAARTAVGRILALSGHDS